MGANWNGRDQGLPNLILPGLYLIVGGVVFWLVGRRTRHALQST
jgi:hypothetical protein